MYPSVEIGVVDAFKLTVNILFGVEQALDGLAADDMLFHDLRHVVGLNVSIERPVGIYDRDGTFGAQAEATRHDYLDFVRQSALGELIFKVFVNDLAVAGRTTRAAAHQDVKTRIPCRYCRALSTLGNRGFEFIAYLL